MTKKIFIAADIHDDKEALARFADLASSNGADLIMLAGDLLLRPYEKADLDAYTTSKDAVTFVDKSRASSRKKLGEMKTILDGAGVPYLVVPGNYDPPIDDVFGESDFHLKAGRLEEAVIAGYGGANAYPQHIGTLMDATETVNKARKAEGAKQGMLQLNTAHGVIPYDEAQMVSFLTAQNPGVILTHNPPYCLCDTLYDGAQVGSGVLTNYVRKWEPRLVVCGHIHEAGPLAGNPRRTNGISGIKYASGASTTVLNPGNLGRFELLFPDNLSTQRQFPFGTFVSVELEADGTPKHVKQYCLANGREIAKDVRVLAEGNIDTDKFFGAP